MSSNNSSINNDIKLGKHHPNNIELFLSEIKTNIQNNFKKILEHKSPCSKLQSALEYVLFSDSKYIRSALIYAVIYSYDKPSHDFSDINNNILLNSATAIELIHTYSLIHDDLPSMDNDDLRRGKPSCHIQFDEATAILAGDCLQTMAYKLLAETNYLSTDNIVHNTLLEKKLDIIDILTKSTDQHGMIAGQSLDLNNINNLSITEDTLKQVYILKTAKLITAALQIGGILVNLDNNKYNLITILGQKLGLAFQIQDDILDYTQNSSTLGKPALSDKHRGLPTYPSVLGLDKTKDLLEQYWNTCFDIINKLNFDNNILENLIYYIKNRVN